MEPTAQIVTMTNGEVKNFGGRGRLLSSQNVTASGLTVTFHVITGEQVVYTYAATGESEFIMEAAGYGIAAKVKNAVSAVEVDKLAEAIQAQVDRLHKGIWAIRATAGESLAALTMTQRAYAITKGIDYKSHEGIVTVNAIFAALSKEAKANLLKDPNIQVAVAELRLQAAKEAVKEAAKAVHSVGTETAYQE